MSENVTNELLFETLKAVQAKLASVADGVLDVRAELRAMKGHMAAFMQSELAQDGSLATIDARIERIERRLEING